MVLKAMMTTRRIGMVPTMMIVATDNPHPFSFICSREILAAVERQKTVVGTQYQAKVQYCGGLFVPGTLWLYVADFSCCSVAKREVCLFYRRMCHKRFYRYPVRWVDRVKRHARGRRGRTRRIAPTLHWYRCCVCLEDDGNKKRSPLMITIDVSMGKRSLEEMTNEDEQKAEESMVSTCIPYIYLYHILVVFHLFSLTN